MASTLPPTPSYDPNIPILTSGGGTAAAYKDPKSPESLLKRTKELEVQATVDSLYDVNVSPYEKKEGFQGFRFSMSSISKRVSTSILTGFLILLLMLLFTVKSFTKKAKVYLVVLSVLLFVLLAYSIQNGTPGSSSSS
jgi:hypothetical protein